jgi:Glucosidase II beta subunit-like protein
MTKNSIAIIIIIIIGTTDSKCQWTSDDGMSSYDLSKLTVSSKTEYSYSMSTDPVGDATDGYKYAWNICAPVTPASTPMDCLGRYGGAVQYIENGMCYVVGTYKQSSDETYALIDETNPAKGISLSYPLGDFCGSMTERSSTIDVYCGNSFSTVKSVEETRTCYYHFVMESYYGCPTSCGITSNGLCNNVGTCEYNSKTKTSACKCDDYYSGSDCAYYGYADFGLTWSTVSGGSSSALITRGIMALLLVAFIAAGVFVGVKLSGGARRRREGYVAVAQDAEDPAPTSRGTIVIGKEFVGRDVKTATPMF